MRDERKLYLTNGWITALFIYYFFIFLSGIVLAVSSLVPGVIYEASPPILHLALIGSIGMSSNGSAIFYIRKLYKLCFRENLRIDDKENTYIRRLGTIIYFFCRPLFAIGFSLLVVIGLKSGFMLTSTKQIELNDGFIFLTMFISFFVGFLAGRFVKKLEVSGDKILGKVIMSETKFDKSGKYDYS
jgi:hypothetical protein